MRRVQTQSYATQGLQAPLPLDATCWFSSRDFHIRWIPACGRRLLRCWPTDIA